MAENHFGLLALEVYFPNQYVSVLHLSSCCASASNYADNVLTVYKMTAEQAHE